MNQWLWTGVSGEWDSVVARFTFLMQFVLLTLTESEKGHAQYFSPFKLFMLPGNWTDDLKGTVHSSSVIHWLSCH